MSAKKPNRPEAAQQLIDSLLDEEQGEPLSRTPDAKLPNSKLPNSKLSLALDQNPSVEKMPSAQQQPSIQQNSSNQHNSSTREKPESPAQSNADSRSLSASIDSSPMLNDRSGEIADISFVQIELGTGELDPSQSFSVDVEAKTLKLDPIALAEHTLRVSRQKRLESDHHTKASAANERASKRANSAKGTKGLEGEAAVDRESPTEALRSSSPDVSSESSSEASSESLPPSSPRASSRSSSEASPPSGDKSPHPVKLALTPAAAPRSAKVQSQQQPAQANRPSPPTQVSASPGEAWVPGADDVPKSGASVSERRQHSGSDFSLKQSEHLRIAQNRITELERELDRVLRDNEQLALAGETLRRRADELAAKVEQFEVRTRETERIVDEEKKVLRGQVQGRERELSELRVRLEEMEVRLESNFKKVRVRERELEHRLEIVKMENATVLGSKDKMILDLKRQLDQLASENDFAKQKSQELFKHYKDKQETIRRVVRALRIALTILEGDEESVAPIKKAE